MKRDVVANFITAAWLAILTFAFTPIYVRYLGVEAYGLIGLLNALQASLGVLDLGLSQVLARELARYSGGAVSTRSIRNLVRSVEIVALVLAVVIAFAIALPSNWIAQSWLRPGQAFVAGLVEAIQIMGVLVALRLLEGLYRGAVTGIHRQFALNVIMMACMTVKTFGSLALFVFISTSVRDFFLWQATVSAINVGLLAVLLYAALPDRHLHGVFSYSELRRISRFAAGLTAASVLGIALTQTDKLLLSKLLSLRAFGEYSLAATLAAAPQIFAAPITQAVQPRFARAIAASDSSTLTLAFHAGAQLLTVIVGSASVVIIVFSGEILALWLQDAGLAARISPLVSLLATGGLLNSLMWLPYALQLAYGWSGLSVRTNIVAVIVLVPAILILAPVYGALGAAWLWVALNFGLFTITAYFMFRRILSDQKRIWYAVDIAAPLLAAIGAALLAKILMPAGETVWQRVIVVGLASAATLATSALAAPLVRTEVGLLIWRFIRRCAPERI